MDDAARRVLRRRAADADAKLERLRQLERREDAGERRRVEEIGRIHIAAIVVEKSEENAALVG